MPISGATVVFPNNVISLLATRVGLLDASLGVHKRPLRPSDETQSVGIFASTWTPVETSHEIGHLSPGEPSLERYAINVQSLIKDMDEETGQATHSVLAAMLRSMLYRDSVLRVGLAALSATMNGSTEYARRWGVRQQKFLNNEIKGSFIFLSSSEFWVETEIV